MSSFNPGSELPLAVVALRIRKLRATALQAMKLLAQFDPRLVGGVISGAVSDANRVQLHAFLDKRPHAHTDQRMRTLE